MIKFSAGLTRALSLLLLAILVSSCIATTGVSPIGSMQNRDKTVTDCNGFVFAPKGTDNQIRVDCRTYEQVGVDPSGNPIWKQIGPTDTTATAGEDTGVKFGTAAIGGVVGNIGGAGLIASGLRGQKGSTATATGGKACSATSGTNDC